MNHLDRVLGKLFPPLKREKFAAKVFRRIRRENPAANTRYDAERFGIQLGENHWVYLSNAYDEYRVAPFRNRNKVIGYYTAVAKSQGNHVENVPLASVKQDLLPKVRERFYHSIVNVQMQLNGDKPLDVPAAQFSENLNIELIEDQPRAIKSISRSDLKRWNLSFEEAMAIARDNLWRRSNENFISPRPGLYVGPWSDANGASRLALHDLIWQLKVKGDHVAAIPNRDLLLVSGSDDEEGLMAMSHLVEGAMEQPRFMTAELVRLNGTKWEPFLPPIDRPSHERFDSLKRQGLAREYGEQKAALDKLNVKINRDVFVATHQLYQVNQTKKLVSRCTWLDGIDSLLPIADEVHIGTMDGGKAETVGVANLARLLAIAPGLFKQEPDLYPPRYLVNAIPTREQIGRASIPGSE